MVIPPGTMLEVNLDLIAEGRLVKQINQAIREAHTALERRKKDGVTSGACKIAVDIGIQYDPEIRDTIAITHCVTLRTPKNEETSLAKEKNGVLLCQPTGSGDDDPDQQRLFDASGRPVGTIDRRTGEIVEPKAVAGKIS